MKNIEGWKPTKFERHGEGWRGSRDHTQLSISSRLHADLSAIKYQAALEGYARGRMLDLGCGFVPLYGVYRSLVSETICVDWPSSLHLSHHLDYEIDLSSSFAHLLEGNYDTVLLTDVLEHVPDPAQTLAEVDTILAPGGRVIVGVPFLYQVHEAPHDYWRMTEYTLARLASSFGWTTLELEPIGGLIEGLFDLTGRLCESYKLPQLVTALVQASGARVGGLARKGLGDRVRRQDRRFPTGYIFVAEKPA